MLIDPQLRSQCGRMDWWNRSRSIKFEAFLLGDDVLTLLEIMSPHRGPLHVRRTMGDGDGDGKRVISQQNPTRNNESIKIRNPKGAKPCRQPGSRTWGSHSRQGRGWEG